MRVLIVDDDEIALELLENTLVEAGYEVESARDGREALNSLRSGLFQLVVSVPVIPPATELPYIGSVSV